MYRLLHFLRRVYVLLVFLILEGFALHFYANSTTYTQARILTLSNRAVGSVYAGIADLTHFWSLGKINRQLEAKVQALENELAVFRARQSEEDFAALAAGVASPYEYVVGQVVRNSVNRQENFLMVDKGYRDGVDKGMAVVTLDGRMVGYVESCSENNAICVSALNKTFRASGKLSRSDHFGSISWPGKSIRYVKLSEVPKYAGIAKGDTVYTTSYSFYFPAGIVIGTVDRFEVDESKASYDIDVKLGADFSALRDVILIRNPEVYERIKLEEEVLGTPTEQ